MSESDKVECYLCGKEGAVLKMAPAASPTLGHYLDFVMAVKWFCPEPCFKNYRVDSHLQRRVHQWQDDAALWARACIRNCSDATLAEMKNLPEGLKVTPSERARCAQLKDKLRDVTQLQDYEDNLLLHKICRNINKNPFQHPQTGVRIDYDTLVENFRALENLTPAERNRLNG